MERIDLIIILGSLFTLLIVVLGGIVIVISQKNRAKAEVELQEMELRRQIEISENTLETQESERQRIGMELHDELGPTFNAIKLYVETMQQKISRQDYNNIDELANQTTSDLSSAINQFSDVSRLLFPTILIKHGLGPALNDLMQRCNEKMESQNMVFQLDFDLEKVNKHLVNVSIYRICQELSTNAMKHSKASLVQFNVSQSDAGIQIEYDDNGQGFATTTDYSGLGLNSIKGRTEAIGGLIETTSILGEGVKVRINIPASSL